MSERNFHCKRDSAFEASSVSISPLKKTKLHDSSSSYSVTSSSSSSSSSSVASSDSGECSVTSDHQSSSIFSGCFSNETNEIAKNSSTFVIDLEANQISETDTSTTYFTSNSREERNRVRETTETESSSLATERRKPREVRKNPSPEEIEELFSELENGDKQKRFSFIDKYNFDIVNDEPLQGRYKWNRLT